MSILTRAANFQTSPWLQFEPNFSLRSRSMNNVEKVSILSFKVREKFCLVSSYEFNTNKKSAMTFFMRNFKVLLNSLHRELLGMYRSCKLPRYTLTIFVKTHVRSLFIYRYFKAHAHDKLNGLAWYPVLNCNRNKSQYIHILCGLAQQNEIHYSERNTLLS